MIALAETRHTSTDPMTRTLSSLGKILALAIAMPVFAQQPAATADSGAVVAAATRFHDALAAGDSSTAMALIADGAQIVESGGVEDRPHYREHHLSGDIEFAKALPSRRTLVQVQVRGDVAWIVSTSVTVGQYKDRAVNSMGAELMVLVRTAQGWKIASVHWSSRARRS